MESDLTYLSKIITAGVINVAEPAATTTSAANSSAIRLLVCWIPNGIACSWICCVMAYDVWFKRTMLSPFVRDRLAVLLVCDVEIGLGEIW